jgi:hypothetical protein
MVDARRLKMLDKNSEAGRLEEEHLPRLYEGMNSKVETSGSVRELQNSIPQFMNGRN